MTRGGGVKAPQKDNVTDPHNLISTFGFGNLWSGFESKKGQSHGINRLSFELLDLFNLFYFWIFELKKIHMHMHCIPNVLNTIIIFLVLQIQCRIGDPSGSNLSKLCLFDKIRIQHTAYRRFKNWQFAIWTSVWRKILWKRTQNSLKIKGLKHFLHILF